MSGTIGYQTSTKRDKPTIWEIGKNFSSDRRTNIQGRQARVLCNVCKVPFVRMLKKMKLEEQHTSILPVYVRCACMCMCVSYVHVCVICTCVCHMYMCVCVYMCPFVSSTHFHIFTRGGRKQFKHYKMNLTNGHFFWDRHIRFAYDIVTDAYLFRVRIYTL